jgi:hypothetical protein
VAAASVTGVPVAGVAVDPQAASRSRPSSTAGRSRRIRAYFMKYLL